MTAKGGKFTVSLPLQLRDPLKVSILAQFCTPYAGLFWRLSSICDDWSKAIREIELFFSGCRSQRKALQSDPHT